VARELRAGDRVRHKHDNRFRPATVITAVGGHCTLRWDHDRARDRFGYRSELVQIDAVTRLGELVDRA
jgi:hypothetical protein